MEHITTYIYQQLQTRYPPEEIRCFVRLILTSVCGLSYTQQISCKDKQIPENEKQQIYTIVDRLRTMEPLQYILGETEFYSIPLKINPSVLIPRPETEELVDLILKSDFVKSLRHSLETGIIPSTQSSHSPFHILDIGTGSGCIAIALAKHIPYATVTAIDISDEALNTAKKNAQSNQIPVRFIQSDILNTEKVMALFPEYFDLIVSNPPYVTTDEKTSLSANVLDYEPHIALFAPDNSPLLFYNVIAGFAKHKLSPFGMIFFEINPLSDTAIIDLLQKKGYPQTEIIRDLSGKNRFITVKKSTK